MSKTIEIHSGETIDPNELYQDLQTEMEAVEAVQKAEEGFYFYQDLASTRGVDLWREDFGYELRLTVLSNAADFQIAKFILRYFEEHCNVAKYFLDSEEMLIVDILALLTNSFEEDANLVKIIVQNQKQTVTLFGPKAEYYVGPLTLQKVMADSPGWEKRLEDLILKVQYHLPSSEGGNIMRVGEGDAAKDLKLVSQGVSYVLKNYDYLIFKKKEKTAGMEDMILVTNEILNEHLPHTWELIDEYTIVAPALSKPKYQELVKKLLPYDRMSDL